MPRGGNVGLGFIYFLSLLFLFFHFHFFFFLVFISIFFIVNLGKEYDCIIPFFSLTTILHGSTY